MPGWIKLHRDITDHWIWKDPVKGYRWMDILVSVNHTDAKVIIGNKVVECGRGQSIRSLESWAKKWNTTKKAVKTFFKLLEKESMLKYEPLQRTTRITVCNYERYQGTGHDQDTSRIRKRHDEETQATPKQEGLKNEKNEKNDKKKFIPPSLEQVVEYFAENGCTEDSAEKAFDHYSSSDWIDSHGNPVRNWKQKMQKVWFTQANKLKPRSIFG